MKFQNFTSQSATKKSYIKDKFKISGSDLQSDSNNPSKKDREKRIQLNLAFVLQLSLTA